MIALNAAAKPLMNEDEVANLAKNFVQFLNDWCPDAWCAGDYKHIFLNAEYEASKKEWQLVFETFPHYAQDIQSNSSEVLETQTGETVLITNIFTKFSKCSFKSFEPQTIFELDSNGELKDLTQEMRDKLIACTVLVEQSLKKLLDSF